MKKMMITMTALGALLCSALTGCTINVTEENMSQAADIAVAVLDDADIKVNGQSVDISRDANGDVNVSIAQTTPAAQTAAAPAVLSEAEMRDISKQLIPEYVSIYDGLLPGCVEKIDDTDYY